jgi:DNA recombination protein RmuC
MMDWRAAVWLLIGLAAGGAAGCWFGLGQGRKQAAPADNRLEAELRAQAQQREKELNEAREQSNAARAAGAAAEAKCEAAERLLAESRGFQERHSRETKEAQEKALADLREAFRALSADALKQTTPQFLELANETLAKFQESAKGDLARRQEAIATLVQPLKEQLESYQRRLQQSESAQSASLGEVRKQIEGLAQHSQALSNETQQLRMVLHSNPARGRWGEETLRRVVEAAGMSAHCDFSEQTQSGESKPDLTVHLPGRRMIIVDAKVPDLDFLKAVDAADPARRAESLAAHAAKLKATIKGLAERNYPAQFPGAFDYVVLFLPAESLFSAALEGDRDLIIWAMQKRIMLATPASLIGLLHGVGLSWQQHAQSENAREIAAAAQELFGRVVKFMEHFEKIRDGLRTAGAAYNDAVGSFEGRVRPSGERLLKAGGGAGGKGLTEIQPLETALRLPPAPPG